MPLMMMSEARPVAHGREHCKLSHCKAKRASIVPAVICGLGYLLQLCHPRMRRRSVSLLGQTVMAKPGSTWKSRLKAHRRPAVWRDDSEPWSWMKWRSGASTTVTPSGIEGPGSAALPCTQEYGWEDDDLSIVFEVRPV